MTSTADTSIQAPQAPEKLYPVEPDVLRYKLASMFEYFRPVIFRLKPVPTKGIGTFGTDDQFHWYYDEEGVPFTRDEQVAVLWHEIQHLVRGHFSRRHDRDPSQWNTAGDMEINDWFPPGLAVPSNKITPGLANLPDGELAEWYFDRIKQYDQHVRVDAGPMDPGKGPCASHPGCDSTDSEPVIGANHTITTRGRIHTPICGGTGNGPNDGKESKDDDGGGGEMTEVEAEAIRQEVAKGIEEMHEKGRGNIPGNLVSWANLRLHPKVPWNKLLKTAAHRAAIIIAGHTSQTYSKPSRRNIVPFVLPKRVARKVTTAFYIDTSGSVSDEELNQAISEVRAALATNATDMYVTFLDAAIQSTVKLQVASDERLIKPKGRGGTDMRLAFDHVKTLKPKPNLIVVLTDGETPWPVDPPRGMRTIIVLSRPGEVPSWAQAIEIN